MSYASNIEFLKQRETAKAIEHQYDILFTAGEVYISAIIDTLTAQAFYNPNIVTILQQILVGRSDSNNAEYEAQLVNEYQDKIFQSNLW
jgi:hypothetical protein|tara:strand:+ start:91 stop:357 length:267 start_codon:yes stop_codon:yes gene_type:complete